jgi:hypothetical protein
LPNIGCNDGLNSASPELAGLGFFPMKIGNRWEYELDNFDDFKWTVEVVGKTTFGPYQYFIFEMNSTLGTRPDSTFYRAAALGQIFINWQGKDALFIDFNRPVGKKWDSFSEYNGVINKKGFTIVVPAGRFEGSIEVFFDIPQAIDDENWNVYAPNVGLVETRGQIGSLQLTSAFVNGISIP